MNEYVFITASRSISTLLISSSARRRHRVHEIVDLLCLLISTGSAPGGLDRGGAHVGR